MAQAVAFVGIGAMGGPMAMNLLKAGFDVTAYNRTHDKLAALKKAGAKTADSPAAAVMPGGIMTGLQKHLTREEQMAMGWFDEHGTPNPRFKSTAQGAATSIWAAVALELEGRGGLYLEDCAIAKPWTSEQPFSGYMPYALDPANADRLWALSEDLLSS
mgnify:CR=1 FL=1